MRLGNILIAPAFSFSFFSSVVCFFEVSVQINLFIPQTIDYKFGMEEEDTFENQYWLGKIKSFFGTSFLRTIKSGLLPLTARASWSMRLTLIDSKTPLKRVSKSERYPISLVSGWENFEEMELT